MTYVMYQKNGNWFRSFGEVRGKPDRTVFVERLDETNNIDVSFEELVEDINKGNYADGMYGYKIPVAKVEEKEDFYF